MDTSMKLLSILAVLLRWAFRGDDGGEVADEPQGSSLRLPELNPGTVPLGNALPR